VLDDMTLLARARKHQYAAFIRDEGVLCVWSDNVKTILAEAEGLEDSLLEYIWNQGHKREKKVGASAFVEAAKAKELLELDEKIEKLETGVEVGDAEDLSKLKNKRQWKERPYVLYDAVTGGATVGLMVVLLSISWRKCRFHVGGSKLNHRLSTQENSFENTCSTVKPCDSCSLSLLHSWAQSAW
jgi:hypothetical protein